MQQHIREKHTMERPYKCDYCAADGVLSAFARQYGLNRHMRQVHHVGAQSSRATTSSATSASGADDGSQRTDNLPQRDELADMAAQLTQANYQMSADSSDVEMSDGQFQFDAGPSGINNVSGTNSGLACGECGYTAARQKEILMHMHASHGVPNTRFCSCNVCTMMFITSESDVMNQAQMLCGGAFHTHSDAHFSPEGPNVAMASAWSSQMSASDAASMGTIDPSGLSFF